MRQIIIEAPNWNTINGLTVSIPVKVNWPELRLTELQILANAIAFAEGIEIPFPDPTLIEVVLKRPQ